MSSRQKIFNAPGVVVAILAVLAGVQGWREYWLDGNDNAALLQHFAFVPGRFLYSFAPEMVTASLDALTSAGGRQVEAAHFLLGDGALQVWTLLTYAGLHADWTHCCVNCIWLLAFGTPVARRFGTARFLVLFGGAAIAGALAHVVAYGADFAPVVGASAAVAGAMAASSRFVFQPGAPLGEGFDFAAASDEDYRGPAPSVLALFANSRVLAFSGLWLVVNVVFGLLAQPLGATQGPVAWQAHIGGFVFGLLVFDWLDPWRHSWRNAGVKAVGEHLEPPAA